MFRHVALTPWNHRFFSCHHPYKINLLAIVFAGICVVQSTSFGKEKSTAQHIRKPNFVIIMADDMGYGDSSVYDGWIKTPNLERMAKEGMKFTDFHSSGVVCSPTRAGLLTGRYQQRAGIPEVINADPKSAAHHVGLQKKETTFAEVLKDSGYTTAIFGKWHLGYKPKHNPTLHGFDRFRGFVSGNIDYISHYDRMQKYDWWEGTRTIPEEGYLTHLLTKHSVEFIRQNKDKPFCLYIPHGAVHSPIQGPGSHAVRGPQKKKTVLKKQKRQQTIREMMKALDENVGTILDTLKEEGIAENTFVLFFSDNGGARHMKNTPLRGRKGTVWEGGHRVPAIAWWPGKITPGTVTTQLCISLDVMPTLLELAGTSVPKKLKLDGKSLVPVLMEQKTLGRRQLFWNGKAMRDGHWKLVLQAAALNRKPGLFNLENDISEKKNLAAEFPERVKSMKQSIEAWKRDVQ